MSRPDDTKTTLPLSERDDSLICNKTKEKIFAKVDDDEPRIKLDVEAAIRLPMA